MRIGNYIAMEKIYTGGIGGLHYYHHHLSSTVPPAQVSILNIKKVLRNKKTPYKGDGETLFTLKKYGKYFPFFLKKLHYYIKFFVGNFYPTIKLKGIIFRPTGFVASCNRRKINIWR